MLPGKDKIDLLRTLVLILANIMFLNSCLLNDSLNQAFVTFTPVDIGDGWIISSPEDENMDRQALTSIYTDAYSAPELWSMRSLLIFRNGKLVTESYLKDQNDVYNRHLIWSATKQVLGVVTGFAVKEGLIENMNDPISKYLIETSKYPDKADITIEDLITMRSGIGFNNDGLGGDTDLLLRKIPDNSIEFVLGIELTGTPGVTYHYNDGNPHLLSAIIQRRAGKPTDEFANEVFFSKIGFTNYNWVRYKDGYTFGAFGIETTPRELAKIAQFVLNQGNWQGTQLLDSAWIDVMTQPHVQKDDGDYLGYYWHIDINRNLHSMDGHGGQFAVVIPNKNLVVVVTAFPNTQDDYQITPDEIIPWVDRIVEAAY